MRFDLLYSLSPKQLLVGCLVISILTPRLSQAQTRTIALSDLPPALAVEESAPELLKLGCEPVSVPSSEPKIVKVPVSKPQPVVSLATENAGLFTCPTNVIQQLSVKGQVEAIFVPILIAAGVGWAIGEAINYATGQPSATGIVASAAGETFLSWATKAVEEVLYWIARLGNYLVHKLAFFVSILLAAQKFATHPFVELGWPFVLGIANLGFIFALLLIAALATMRLEIGGGTRRLLPRLLIAALLVNFSLVVGAAIIDATRVLMAILFQVIGGDKLENIGAIIIRNSQIFTRAIISGGSADTTKIVSGAGVWDLLLTAVFLWLLVVALFALVAGLFMRYIMLILLLVFSPLAYLALSLPNTGNLAKKWWTTFLKYAFYGPAALFVLLLITVMPPLGDTMVGLFGVTNKFTNRMYYEVEALISVVIVIVLLMAAASIGRFMGIAGATAAVGFAAAQGKRLGRGTMHTAKRAGVGTAKGVAKAAYIGSGARKVVRETRAFGSELVKPVQKKFGLGKYSKFDEKGKLRDGKTSVGQSLGAAVGQRLPQALGGDRNKVQESTLAQKFSSAYGQRDIDVNTDQGKSAAIRNIVRRDAPTTDQLTRPDLVAKLDSKYVKDLLSIDVEGIQDQRVKQEVGTRQRALTSGLALNDSMDDKQITAVLESGNENAVKRLATNINIVNNMSGGQKAKILQFDNESIIDQFTRSLSRLENKNKK
ncbi:MAG: hypothetical protein WEC84_02520 [Candidatus Andersenbacteria bacterium]